MFAYSGSRGKRGSGSGRVESAVSAAVATWVGRAGSGAVAVIVFAGGRNEFGSCRGPSRLLKQDGSGVASSSLVGWYVRVLARTQIRR